MNRWEQATMVAACFAVLAHSAAAETIVHVTGTTYGCVKPKFSLRLAGPATAARADAGWLARTMAEGQCVAITPASPWEPVSNDAGGETLLEYRGTTAQPGTFWVPTTAVAYPLQDIAELQPPAPLPTPLVAPTTKPFLLPRPGPQPWPKAQPPSAGLRTAISMLVPDPGSAGDVAVAAPTDGGAGAADDGVLVWVLLAMFGLVAVVHGKRRMKSRPAVAGKRSRTTVSAPNVHVSSRMQVNRSSPAEQTKSGTTTAASASHPGTRVSGRVGSVKAPRINISSMTQLNRGSNQAIDPARKPVATERQQEKVATDPIWHPPGSTTTVAGHVIADGMIYLGNSAVHASEKTGCIVDPSLQVGPPEKATPLGFCTSYRDITAVCRGVYLQWLADGRRRPDVSIGYVFMFVYGLERRLLVDRPAAQESWALIAEIHRLRSIYGADHAFESYSRRLIEAATALVMHDTVFTPALDAPAGSFPFLLAIAIGRKVFAKQTLRFELAAAGLMALPWDKGVRDSLVLDTVRPQFLEVLRHRFEHTYPCGFLPSGSASEPLSLEYYSAATSLRVDLATAIGKVPDPSKMDWSELVDFAREVAKEAAPFFKLLAYHPERMQTLAAAAMCPPELAVNVGAEARQWLESLPKPISVIQFGELATRAIGKSLQKWTLREQREVRDALLAFGREIDPDPDDDAEQVECDTPVSVFANPDCAAPRSPRFGTALAATHFVVAFRRSTDDAAQVVEEAWLLQLRTRLALRDSEMLRLRAKLAWLRGAGSRIARAVKLLGNADLEDRTLAAWSATVAAVACGMLDNTGIAALEEIHDQLRVPRTYLYSTMHTAVAAVVRGAVAPVAIADPEAAPPIVHAIPTQPRVSGNLSEDRLRCVRAETEQVSVLLEEIFSEEEGPISVADVSRSGGQFQGLDDSHATLLRHLISRPAWPRAELDGAARRAGLMPDGAIETINEWALDRYNVPLLEHGDPLAVNTTLLQDGGALAAC